MGGFISFCISKTVLFTSLNILIFLIEFNCCKIKKKYITKKHSSYFNDYTSPRITNLSDKYCINSLTFFKLVTLFRICNIIHIFDGIISCKVVLCVVVKLFMIDIKLGQPPWLVDTQSKSGY